MEQPCYKCGQSVEEGVPFCPHCSAPQIRVAMPEPPSPAPVLAAEMAPSAVVFPPSQAVPALALPTHWSQALRPCGLAALVASLLMSLGLNPFVAMLTVGFLAVIFYRQRFPGPIRGMLGAGIGALAGLLWFAISSIFEAGVVLFLHKGPELREALIQKIQQASTQTKDPQVLEMFDRMKTPSGLELVMIAGLAFAFVAAIVLGSFGGALGAAILGRRERP